MPTLHKLKAYEAAQECCRALRVEICTPNGVRVDLNKVLPYLHRWMRFADKSCYKPPGRLHKSWTACRGVLRGAGALKFKAEDRVRFLGRPGATPVLLEEFEDLTLRAFEDLSVAVRGGKVRPSLTPEEVVRLDELRRFFYPEMFHSA